ncbi:MAG TPA: DivIVA domain-containing protein [Acidimicrobiales bacterium]|nr:DivIVA domain-containing protein [Acidimicrobiales bacterium]
MPTDRIHPRRGDAPDMSADMIAGRRFAQSWRGYDADEVGQFLAQVAAQVRALREKVEQSDAARREAEKRASHPEIDEATLMAAVGEQTATILRAARAAAAEITAKARAEADAIATAADARATEVLTEAEAVLARRAQEADATAAEIVARATSDAEKSRGMAQEQAQSIVEAANKQGEETVRSAQLLREKILTDLARRRKLGTVQVEQLRAGRERLLDAYMVVRRTLDEVTDELQRAEAEARAAAEAAGRQHAPGLEELVDLRADEAWRAAAASEARPLPEGATDGAGEAGTTTSTSATTGTGAAAPPDPAPPRPLVTTTAPAESGEQPDQKAVPPKLGPPAPLPTPSAPATNGERARPAGSTGAIMSPAGGRDVVSRSDAIESVRIVRAEPADPATVPAALPATGPGTGPGTAHDVVDRVPEGAQDDVEGLFARIRASRAEATESARRALHQGAPQLARAPSDEQGPSAPPSPLEEYFERREQVLSRLESLLGRKLKRALQDEQNSLLDRLRNLKGPLKPADVLPNVEEQPDRFVEAGRAVLAEAVQAGRHLVASMFGGSAQPGPRPEVVDGLAEELGRAIADPLRQRLEQALRATGDDPGELAEALGPPYREWKTQRIEAEARDQVSAAFAHGAFLALPAGSPLAWVAAPGESACPDCEDNALARGQVKGESWPTGQLHPPAHPGCGCALVPASSLASAGVAAPTGRTAPAP